MASAHEDAEIGSGHALKDQAPPRRERARKAGLTRSGPPHAEHAKRTWSWMQRGTFAGCSAMRRFSTAESRTDDSKWQPLPDVHRDSIRGLTRGVFSSFLASAWRTLAWRPPGSLRNHASASGLRPDRRRASTSRASLQAM